MQYRDIGKTGKKAGIIGLGCEHLDGKPYGQVQETIDTALEGGVNYMDVFMPGREVRENIAKALGARRKDVYLQGHIGSTDINQQYDISRDMPTVQRYFEDLLRIFGGYIDFGMLFFIDTEKDYKAVFDGGLADYALKRRQSGEIGHIGFSSHNPAIATKAIETGLPEVMMFSLNLGFDLFAADTSEPDISDGDKMRAESVGIDPARTKLYALCEQRGVGISVMKTLGAGKLISPQHTPFTRPMSVAQCVHYVLSRPAVFSTMLGCQTGEEVRHALAYLDADEETRDYTPFLGELQQDFGGRCVYCSHCQPCPVDIDIAAVNKYLDIAKLDTENVPQTIRLHYAALSAGGADCIACGSCEARCPFGVPIIKNMEQAAALLG